MTGGTPRARWSGALRLVRTLAYGTGALLAGGAVATSLLVAQARAARKVIPLAEAPPPRGDGLYGAKLPGPPLTLALLGDSSAAGYGVRRPRETPGALLATGISRRLGRPVRLHRLAVVGATSDRLGPQVEVAVELGPELAVILVGGNDVTRLTHHSIAVRHLVDAVRALRAAGARVVVGTCPDLGTIQPIKPPLRWLVHRWSRQLAAAQTVAVVEAGGWTVSLGDLLAQRFSAEPARMFSADHFHPSADGYATAVSAMLPTALAALGAAPAAAPAATEVVQALPVAARQAARRPGTEVSGVRVAGRERSPHGRWARLRRGGTAVVAPQRTDEGDVPLSQQGPDRTMVELT
ncbi:SGNH/GDSL hydrolase family protein [Rhizomonospora bruguierae]|uniref:SGNH/GDSL hydrolase family protein n=1 Tax=Rhizomonospora bruguierae TaxID=1581705 RepID=UPI001BD12DDD|nr:SGNH/GDSL hydrolase family protein [Micromonospora sp. NBRC 107566]